MPLEFLVILLIKARLLSPFILDCLIFFSSGSKLEKFRWELSSRIVSHSKLIPFTNLEVWITFALLVFFGQQYQSWICRLELKKYISWHFFFTSIVFVFKQILRIKRILCLLVIPKIFSLYLSTMKLG